MSLRQMLVSLVTIVCTFSMSTVTTTDSNSEFVMMQTTMPSALASNIEISNKTPEEETLTEEPAEVTEVSETENEKNIEESTEKVEKWTGEVLNARNGVVQGPSGKETYYNLNMSGVIRIMESLGYDYEYHIREDGVKMYGPYIMVAANLELRPRGTILETSLGTAIVCDTGSFAKNNPTQIDIAVSW